MKRVLIALMAIISLHSAVNAQIKDSVLQNVTVVSTDTNVADSLYTDSANVSSQRDFSSGNIDANDKYSPLKSLGATLGTAVLVPVITIVLVFGLPVFVIFLVFFFRYKNRKARYRLAEQALAAGQPLPEELIKESGRTINYCSQGIKNTFLGIGLFVSLWAITETFSIGAIGLLVMFIGIGQWLVGYQQEKKNKDENRENL